MADMLAHSPLFPLARALHCPTWLRTMHSKDEDADFLRSSMQNVFREYTIPRLCELLTTVNEPFPALESLLLWPRTESGADLTLSSPSQAPRPLNLIQCRPLTRIAVFELHPLSHRAFP
jgi:hypothetical protein